MQTPDDPAAAPPAASDPAAVAAAAAQPADPPRSPDTAETPLLKHGHTTYSDSSASSGAASAAESSSAAAPSVRARRQSRPPSDGGELFQGLGRGLSAAASMSQKRRGSDSAAGSSNEVTDDSDDELEGGGGSGSRSSALSSRKAGSGSGGLSSPLISPHAPSSSPPSRRQDSVLRRHIKLTNAEFVMTPAERSIAFAEKGFIERRLRPEVQRTDLFRDNFVRSSRYTLFTFLPMNLFEQLSPLNKPANFYFLIIAVLQCINEISTTGGRPSILVPLTFVLAVTALKDATEDYARHKQDRLKNLSAYQVYRQGEWRRILSKNLLVGDIVKIKDGQRVPSDILLLSSGISNGSYAFVDTKELDGETALKPKQVPLPFLSVCKRHWRHLQNLQVDLRTDVPNQVMNAWSGDLTVNGRRDHVSLGNFLLTDSVLKNTPWACGLVVYTGEDTKIRMNMAKQIRASRQKESSVFRLTKRLFLAMVVVQFVVCVAAAIDAGIKQRFNQSHHAWYMDPSQAASYYAFLRLFTNFIIVKDFIPISLYVSLELVQFWQAQFIAWDRRITLTIEGEEFPASAQTSKLNEELSQVGIIMSDKTGTLTRNAMVFRKAVIAGEIYGTGTTEAGRLRKHKMEQAARHRARKDRLRKSAAARDSRLDVEAAAQHSGTDSDDDPFERPSSPHAAEPDELLVPHVEFNETRRIAELIQGMPPLSQRLAGGAAASSSSSSSSSSGSSAGGAGSLSQAEMVQLFLYALALNNSVFPKPRRAEEGDSDDEDEQRPRRSGGLPRVSSVDGGSGMGTSRIDVAAEEAEERAREGGADQPVRADEEVVLEASSPDERALVAFAQALGFELVRRSAGKVDLRVRKMDAEQILAQSRAAQQSPSPSPSGDSASSDPAEPLAPGSFTVESFSELCMLDFTSKRKRMTVLLRLPDAEGNPSDRVLVLIKGADSSLKPLLTATPADQWDRTLSSLGEMGGESLRTLLVGYAVQDLGWWERVRPAYDEAQRHQGPSEKGHVEGNCSDECALCAAENAIEQSAGLTLLGATAIEDKLQEHVPHTLAQLLKAGISIWILTGDQVSTATNIAISCNLLDADMASEGRLFTFDRDLAASPEAIDAHLRRCERRMAKAEAQAARDDDGAPLPEMGMCFHGDVFKVLQEEEEESALQAQREGKSPSDGRSSDSASAAPSLHYRFFSLAARCRSVVACRLEPKEKADIVRIMKRRTGLVVLAIGDGNNDVSMLKQADIGVGIRGVEGTSAVASSDYAIATFSFLARLLLVHGRLNYRRIAILINYVFYKSSFLVWTLLLYGLFSQFSGQYLYLDWAVQLHNVCYTAFPIVVFATLDRDLATETLEQHPHIYTLTRGPVLFNARIFAQWMALAFAQALICFFIPFFSFEAMSSPSPSGQSFGLWSTGMCVYVCVVVTTNLKLLWVFQSWTAWHHFTLWGSIAVFFAAMAMFSSSPKFAIGGADYFFVFFRLAELARFWLVVLVTVGCCVVLDLAMQGAVRLWVRSSTQRIVEVERTYRDQPRMIRAVAKALAKEALDKEQSKAKAGRNVNAGPTAAASAGGRKAGDSGAGGATWNDASDASAESRRRALLSRRRANKDARRDAPSIDEESSSARHDSALESPDVAVMPAPGATLSPPNAAFTGFAYSFTPRSSYSRLPSPDSHADKDDK